MNESERTPAKTQPNTSDMIIEVPDWVKNGSPKPVEPSVSRYEVNLDKDPFAVGKEIVIMRNGKNNNPDYQDGGWKIIDNDTTVKIDEGKYMVGVRVEKEINGEMWEKDVPLDQVVRLNSTETASSSETAEKPPLSDAQEDIAEEAIEDAIGLKDPEDAINDPATDMLKDFSEDDRMLLKSYALAIADQREAHAAAHSGEDVRPGASQEAAQNAAWALKQLSPKAKEIASRFVQVYPGK